MTNNTAIITDTTVAQLYGEALCSELEQCTLFTFESGEQNKTLETAHQLLNSLAEKGFGKDCCIIGLGGGVVTDIAGFVAATYCRGVKLVLIPTTVMAICDATIGGKNGVNLPQGKNLVGTIYEPSETVIDPKYLETLPQQEWDSGFVEVIKHGLIAEPSYCHFILEHADEILRRDLDVMQEVVDRSVKIKSEIVKGDLYESGKRRILNYGHTIGHAIEKVTNYTIPHGFAVAAGLLVEGEISHRLGYMPKADLAFTQELLKRFSIPCTIPQDYQTLLSACQMDKKGIEKKARYVLLKEIGNPISFNGAWCRHVDDSIVLNACETVSSLQDRLALQPF